MIKGRRVLAVVPARGGSKGIPLKNLKEVGGLSLIAWVGKVIEQIPEIDRSVVSTDHEMIAQAAEAAGIDAPFRRPEELSGDRIGDLDVLRHALLTSEALDGLTYDIVLMLQPTSPLRQPEDVRACLIKLVEEKWDAVWTVSETDSKNHPLKQLKVESDGALNYYDATGSRIIARQQLGKLYHRNGVAYAISRECLLMQSSIKGEHTGAVIIEGQHISIDTPWDLALVDFILARKK